MVCCWDAAFFRGYWTEKSSEAFRIWEHLSECGSPWGVVVALLLLRNVLVYRVWIVMTWENIMRYMGGTKGLGLCI